MRYSKKTLWRLSAIQKLKYRNKKTASDQDLWKDRLEVRKGRGRPRKKWRDDVMEELNQMEMRRRAQKYIIAVISRRLLSCTIFQLMYFSHGCKPNFSFDSSLHLTNLKIHVSSSYSMGTLYTFIKSRL